MLNTKKFASFLSCINNYFLIFDLLTLICLYRRQITHQRKKAPFCVIMRHYTTEKGIFAGIYVSSHSLLTTGLTLLRYFK